jgi:hypothetical protein
LWKSVAPSDNPLLLHPSTKQSNQPPLERQSSCSQREEEEEEEEKGE